MYSKRIVKEYITDAPEPITIKNKLSGAINEADTEDRTIWAYDRNDGELLGSTLINRNTRQWELYLDPTHNDESITLICRDESGNFNCDAFDRVSLCMAEYPYPSGITTLFTYPENLLADVAPKPLLFSDLCSVDVPELKGDIAKVIQVGDIADREYTVKYVNASGSEITNDVTANNVIVNDTSVVLNKKTRSVCLGEWQKDIFGDGSEIVHPVWDGKQWKNYYSGVPFEILFGPFEGISPTLARGKYEEPALCVNENIDAIQGIGLHYNVDTQDVTTMSVSFWYKTKGNPNDTDYSQYGINNYASYMSVCSAFTDDITNLFTLGVAALSNSWTAVTKQNNYIITAKNNTVNTSQMTLANSSFFDWHHFVITYTAATLNLYIDKNLVKSLTFANTQIGNMVRLILGKLPKFNNNYNWSHTSKAGIYSNLRVFNKVVDASEVETLYNDTPIITKDVTSIKGMEYDKGLLCLGGIPYTPVLSSDKYVYTYNNGYTAQVFLKGFNIPPSTNGNRSFILNTEDVEFIRHSSTAGAFTGLSSRPDNDETQDMGVDIANIDVYFRVYLVNTGYVLKLGNTNKAISFYWYNNNNGFRVCYPKEDGTRADETTRVGAASKCKDKWVRVLWLQNKLYMYEDDGTTLIDEYTFRYPIASSTLGQISVGCNRAGCMDDKTEVYGGRCKISDVYIYEAGKMNTDEPILKYEFGYERDGLAGLYLYEQHQANVQSGNINYDVSKLNEDCVYLSSNQYGNFEDIKQSLIDEDRGCACMMHYAANPNEVLASPSNFFQVGDLFGMGGQNSPRRLRTAIHTRSTESIKNNTKVDSSSYVGADTETWNHIGVSINRKECVCPTYINGVPLNFLYVTSTPYIPEDTSNVQMFLAGGNGVGISHFRFYDRPLPPSSFRNATQNIDGVCYKNDMLVAFINENTAYPIYANTPLTKIHVEGDDNGQVLTFACTKNHTDYYVFTTEWVKILMQNDTMWQYWDGSVWQSGGMVKWSALAMAMDIAANRMSLDKLNSLSALQLNTLHDLNNGTFDLAVGMKSDGSVSPYIDRITYNNERVWVSPVYDLADFSDTDYITKIYLSKILSVGQTDGIKLFVHHSNELGWQECQNFSEVPGIVKNTTNTGTVQFKVTFDQSKDNGKETALLKVTIK